jgi:hypothetical protein
MCCEWNHPGTAALSDVAPFRTQLPFRTDECTCHEVNKHSGLAIPHSRWKCNYAAHEVLMGLFGVSYSPFLGRRSTCVECEALIGPFASPLSTKWSTMFTPSSIACRTCAQNRVPVKLVLLDLDSARSRCHIWSRVVLERGGAGKGASRRRIAYRHKIGPHPCSVDRTPRLGGF